MKTYEYDRIEKLDENLRKEGVAPETIAAIMEGGENIRKSMDTSLKADWMRGAMQRMDNLLDLDTRRTVREGCACCLGGKRGEMVRLIAKRGGSLEERVQAANRAKLVFGNSVTLQENGQVLVRFWPEDATEFRCPCLPRSREPISMTYCFCCGGHVKHHLGIALGREVKVQVVSSVLSSGGSKPCTFLFTLGEETAH